MLKYVGRRIFSNFLSVAGIRRIGRLARRYNFYFYDFLNLMRFWKFQELRFSWRWVLYICISNLKLKFETFRLREVLGILGFWENSEGLEISRYFGILEFLWVLISTSDMVCAILFWWSCSRKAKRCNY